MPRQFCSPLFAVPALFLTIASAYATDASYDVIIRNGHIIDGTGSPCTPATSASQRKDRGYRLPGKWPRPSAPLTRGMVVAPGFIDMLGQSEDHPGESGICSQNLSASPSSSPEKVAPQRRSMTPSSKPTRFYDHFKIQTDWKTWCYLCPPAKQGMGINQNTRRRNAGPARGAGRRQSRAQPC